MVLLPHFNSSHRSIKEAIKRAAELEQCLDEIRLKDLERARRALVMAWPFLSQESDVSNELRDSAATLGDLLERESFYKELPAIDQNTRAIEAEYNTRLEDAIDARIVVYSEALDQLVATPRLERDRRRSAEAPRRAFRAGQIT